MINPPCRGKHICLQWTSPEDPLAGQERINEVHDPEPIRRNDGTAVDPGDLAQVLESLWRPFGGMTNEGLVSGHWIDPADGQHYQDECIKVSQPQEEPMTKTAKRTVGKIQGKAQQLLDFTRDRAKGAKDWVELHNAVFGIGGKATELFPTEADRTAFSKTEECKQVYETFNQLPHPPGKRYDELLGTANGAISVRLPRSVHAALLAEAESEGVSLNQLCLSKLLVQLQSLVR